MSKAKVVIVATAIAVFSLIAAFIGRAQTGCPALTPGTVGLNGLTSEGIQNGANVTIEVVGSTLQAGDSMVQAAANNWTTLPSATFKFAIQNVNSVQSGNATASNPVMIFTVGPASEFAPNQPCAGAIMCSQPPSLDSSGHVIVGQIDFNPGNTTQNTFFQRAFDHELGHEAFGLGDCNNCDNSISIMASPATSSTDTGPQACDQGYVFTESGGAYGTDPNPPPPTCTRQTCPSGYYWNMDQCACESNSQNPPPISPIVIDAEGEGFHLTSGADGVKFDIRGDGNPIQMAWTDPHYHNAFLALDRNGDGKIESGKELFGNYTPQPQSEHPNGFLALAEFDKPENGGNSDGVIDEHDAVFSKLRLWIDENHDGISQPGELHGLSEFGIHSLSLSYYESRRADAFGNQFRYRAFVNPGGQSDFRDLREHGETHEAGRWAYDVFFVTAAK